MTYEELLILSESENLIVKEKNIPGYGGRVYKNRIAINRSLRTQAEKSCVLAEELGHHYTNYGDIMDQDIVQNRKQELRARLRGYDMQIGLIGIIECYKHHCRSLYEMADLFQRKNLSIDDLLMGPDFFQIARECYNRKYGENLVTIDNYAIRFVPSLQVMEFWK